MLGPRRPRRITEAQESLADGLENLDPTIFESRKADHKRRLTQSGIPERTNMTMFDLVSNLQRNKNNLGQY